MSNIQIGNIREILSNGEKKYLVENRPDMDIELEDNADVNNIFYRGYNNATGKVALIVNDLCWENIDPTTLELDGTDRTYKFKSIPNIRPVAYEYGGYEYVEYNVFTWLDERIIQEKDAAKKAAYQARRVQLEAEAQEAQRVFREEAIEVEETIEEIVEEVIEENIEEIVEEVIEENIEEIVEEAIEETIEEIVEPIVEPIVDEKVSYFGIFKDIAAASMYLTTAVVVGGTNKVLRKIVG